MRLTPIEIRSHRFNTRMRGFDTAEVQAFLDTVVSDFEEVVRENARLRRETERLARELDSHRGREQNLQDTLTTAQDMVEQLKRTATKEAEVMISQAELRAEKLMDQAQSGRSALELEIAELRHLRGRLSADLRKTVEGYLNLIGAYDEAHSRAEPIPVEPEPESQAG